MLLEMILYSASAPFAEELKNILGKENCASSRSYELKNPHQHISSGHQQHNKHPVVMHKDEKLQKLRNLGNTRQIA